MQIRPTSYQLQIKIFKKYGCIYVRTKGDHMVYHYPEAIRPVVIPKYKQVPAFVIRNNMRTIGMTRDEYFLLLEKKILMRKYTKQNLSSNLNMKHQQ